MSEPTEREQLEDKLALVERGLEEVTRQLVDSIEELHEVRLERDHALERCADRDAVDEDREGIAGELSDVLADRETIRSEQAIVLVDREAIRGELEAVVEDRAAIRGAMGDELIATRASLEETRQELDRTRDALERLRAHPVVRMLRSMSRGGASGEAAGGAAGDAGS